MAKFDGMEKRLAFLQEEESKYLAARLLTQEIWQKARARQQEIVLLERQIGEEAGLPHAVRLLVGIPKGLGWRMESGFGMPTTLFCEHAGGAVVFHFPSVEEARMGGLNDEVFDAHSLLGSGLEVGGFFEVKNSLWKQCLQEGNAIHSAFDAGYWKRVRHFLFRDKGGEFACLAPNGEYWLVEKDWRVVSSREALAARKDVQTIPAASRSHWPVKNRANTGRGGGLP